MQKLYAYVDETGQDTEGKVFFVSVVIVEQEREQLADILETIERESEKHKRKWSKSQPERRYAYIRTVLSKPVFIGKLYYSQTADTKNYVGLTIQTTALAITKRAQKEYKATVVVDGLSRPEERTFAAGLRKRYIRTEKIRGAKEETDVFLRLADAVCGFLREAQEGKVSELKQLMERGIKAGYFIRV